MSAPNTRAIPGSGPAPVPGASTSTSTSSNNTQTPGPREEPSSAQGPQLISVRKPTGGGAIQGIGEKVATQPATGIATLTIPIGATEARPGGTPSLALGYSSGSGNGPFGIGWSLNIGSITRRVSKGRPQYEDARDSDVFILQDEEDLVPTSKQPQVVGDYSIRRYQPRSEGSFARIERVTHTDDPGDVHWRVTSRDNVLSVYGRDASSRIQSASQDNPHIFSWLLCETYDVSGNSISYVYKSEDDEGIDLGAVNERNRTSVSRSTQRYIKSIRYGNSTPAQRTSIEDPTTALGPLLSGMPSTNWAFELVFDYGDHHLSEPTPAGDNPWPCRQDSFSTYHQGFEVRTYRLGRRVLVFHRFPDELGVDALLVNALELKYNEQPTISFLTRATSKGYVKRDTDPTLPGGVGSYFSRALPPLDFEYTAAVTGESLARSVVKEVDGESLENLPEGVTGSSYQWLDLYGEGLEGVFAVQGGSWFYKRNLSAAGTVSSLEDGTLSETVTLGPIKVVNQMPNISDTEKPRFVDLNGDGSLVVADMTGLVRGFYATTAEASPNAALGQYWDEFRPFESWPSGIDVDSPNVRFIDLTGDGRADILITEDQVLTYHVSLGNGGYGASRSVHRETDEERGPRVLFSDVDESIYFADMSGDGTSDLCRVRNGEICYWPNLGYGRFGAKVTMDNSPYFDRAEAFTQKRVLMTDIDGSGATDIIYVGSEGVTLHFNNSGNGWAKAEYLPSHLLPPIDTLASITATDLMGNGTNCLVWSSSAASDTRSPLKYIDFNHGIKPHLLVKITNNIGKETNLSYLPSTTFYLRDELEGKPWVTRLPFPVQCLERVRTYDAVGRSYHTSRYAYHHGYFDGHDREFRGFGMVEQWDTESFGVSEKFSPLDVANVNEMSFSPPVLTRRWYHTGVYVDHEQLQREMAREYAGAADLTVDQFEQFFAREVVKDLVLDSDGLSAAEARDASRALKGSLLREEIYALDESPLAYLPYRIIDYGFNVKILQRHGVSDVSVCHTYQREQIAYSSEREAATQNDRRIQHGLTLKVGEYGNILSSVQISYGRAAGKSPLEGEPKKLQETTRIILDDMSYTNAVDEKGDVYSLDYRAPLQSTATKYELFGVVLKVGEVRFQPGDFTLDKFTEVPFDSPVTGLAKRIMARNVTLYRKNNLTDMLEQGKLESMAIEGISYTLAFTPELLAKYKRSGKALILDEEDVLHKTYKYERLKGNEADWWLPTAKMFYHVDPAVTPAEELESAKAHFFTPLRILDPYGFSSTIELDSHFLTLKSSTDAVGNVSSYVHDYSNMKPIVETDPNGNRSAFKYDCLGRLVASSVMGKESEKLGDSLDGIQLELAEHEMADFAAEPVEHSADLLKGATVRYIYDLEQYYKEKGPSTPVFAATLSRITHMSDLAEGAKTKIGISFTYFDGLGRDVQTKAIAERDPATPLIPRWVGSAWKVLNNKDDAVRVFNPFFDDTHAFKADWKVGVSPYFMYDALGRLVATAMPNKTWTKVVHGSWDTKQFDANDTVLMDPKSDPDVGTYFSRLPDSEYFPTWYDQRKDGAMGVAEKKAAEKSALHNNTPMTITVDAMGNEFLSTKDNGNSEKFITYRVFDAKGFPRETRDAKGRLIERKTYDAVGNEALKETMDTANTWILHDATGSLVLSWHGKEQKWRRDYDSLGRETHKYLLEGEENDEKEILFEMRVYGEGESEPEKQNLRGQLFRIYDQAGTETSTQFNFKDELVTRQRQLAVEYSSTLDWTDIASIPMEPDIYPETTHTNALGQTTYSQSADGSALRYTYNAAGLPEKIEANVRGEKKPNSDDLLWVAYVAGVEYNELAFATTISFGNGQRTTNDFDKLTLLLKTRQTVSSQRAGARIQDLGYTYDPSGNITLVSNNAQQDVFFRNRVVSADAEYTYDATYRLIESSGREQLDQGGKTAPPGAFQAFENEPRSGDPLSRYVESFKYDSANNILSIQHSTADEKASAWTRTYTYEEASVLEPNKMGNRLSSTQVGGVTDKYGYDGKGGEFGCLTLMPHLASIGWDSTEQLKMTTRQNVKAENDGDNGGTTPERTWYVYDNRGTRIRKVIERQEGVKSLASSPRKLKEWTYLGDYELFRKYAGNGVTVTTQNQTLHVHGSNGRLALIEDWTGGDHPGRLIRYQIVDHLDAVAIEVDEKGNLVSYEEYSAYGSTTYQMQNTQKPKRFRWASKERDKENGFYYSEARYYASWLGRWISADPSGIDDDLNIFAYVSCRPTEYSDPTGLGKGKSKGKDPKTDPGGATKTIVKTPKEQSKSRMKLRHKRINNIRTESGATAPITPSDPNTIIQGEIAMRNLLATTWERTQLHHVYPQEYRDQFKKIGIDVDNFTVSITDEVHRICTHGGEANGSKLGSWNKRWEEMFFEPSGSGYNDQMKDYDTLDDTKKSQVVSDLLKRARIFCGIIMAEYGLRHMHDDGQTKFLDYNYIQNMKEDSERSQIKSANLIHHKSWATISSVSYNSAVSDSGTANDVSAVQFTVTVNDFSSLSGEKLAAWKLLFGTPPTSIASTSPAPSTSKKT